MVEESFWEDVNADNVFQLTLTLELNSCYVGFINTVNHVENITADFSCTR